VDNRTLSHIIKKIFIKFYFIIITISNSCILFFHWAFL